MLFATTNDWLAFLLVMYFIAGAIFCLSSFLNTLIALRHLKPPKEWWSKSFVHNRENYTDEGKVYFDGAHKHDMSILFWLIGAVLVIALLKWMNFRG